MKSHIRNALLGAAGLVALSLPAHAAGSTTVTDAPLFKSNTMQQLAQRPYDPSAGSVGFKKSKTTTQQLAQRPYDPSAGSVGFKKSKKKKAKK
jgi:hypothetical protein